MHTLGGIQRLRLILKLYVAGVGSVVPEATARTAKVCLPTLSLNVWPDVHGAYAFPSTLHWNVAPAIGEENSKDDLGLASSRS